jgi:hypothetical protein
MDWERRPSQGGLSRFDVARYVILCCEAQFGGTGGKVERKALL